MGAGISRRAGAACVRELEWQTGREGFTFAKSDSDPPAQPRARRQMRHLENDATPAQAARELPHELANAESNALADGSMAAKRRMNASAYGAPTSRSMPASSHSIEIGPS